MHDFANTLQRWRKARRFSQLELALISDVSSKHISFLETGRAKPSVDMVLRLSDSLALPLSSRNQLLTAAGFAPRFSSRSLQDEEMAVIRAAMEHTLLRHAPYPAIAIDRLWKIVRMNYPAEHLFGSFGIEVGNSLLDLMASESLTALVENWPEVAHHSSVRLRTESAAYGGIRQLDEAATQLEKITHPLRDKPQNRAQQRQRRNKEARWNDCPVVPTILRLGDVRLSLFSTIAQFGTPQDLTLEDLKIELFFPADEETRDMLYSMAGSD